MRIDLWPFGPVLLLQTEDPIFRNGQVKDIHKKVKKRVSLALHDEKAVENEQQQQQRQKYENNILKSFQGREITPDPSSDKFLEVLSFTS